MRDLHLRIFRLFETELVFGALLLGVMITVFFDNVSDEMIEAYR